MFFLWNTIVLGMFFYWNIEVQRTVIPIFNMNQKNVIVWFLLLKPITNLTIIGDFQKNVCDTSRELLRRYRLRVVPHFSSQIVERAWKSLHARKGDTRRGERKMIIFLSPRRVSPFLAWSDFHARSTICEEKWGTTRSLYRLSNSRDVSQTFFWKSPIIVKLVIGLRSRNQTITFFWFILNMGMTVRCTSMFQ